MPANMFGFGSVILSMAAFSGAYWVLRQRGVRLRLIALAAFTLLAVPSILYAVYYLHILPEQAWFYTLRSYRGSELLLVFLGLSAGSFATFLPRLLLAFPLFGLLLLGIVPYLKPLLSPLPSESLQEIWVGGACLQSTWATCGPASVSTMLRALQVESTEREAARAAYTYAGGTDAWYLARYVRDKGLQPDFIFQKGFSPETSLPAMVGVRIGGMGHFIAVLAEENGMIVFADPLSGMERIPLADFLKRYRFTGFRMVVNRK